MGIAKLRASVGVPVLGVVNCGSLIAATTRLPRPPHRGHAVIRLPPLASAGRVRPRATGRVRRESASSRSARRRPERPRGRREAREGARGGRSRSRVFPAKPSPDDHATGATSCRRAYLPDNGLLAAHCRSCTGLAETVRIPVWRRRGQDVRRRAHDRVAGRPQWCFARWACNQSGTDATVSATPTDESPPGEKAQSSAARTLSTSGP